jgi:D-alanyl-D-alanine carboxypeptidase
MPPTHNLPPKVAAIHLGLGITPGYPGTSGMQPVPECARLLSAGQDVFGRETLMDGEALAAWQRMQKAAANDGVALQLVSAFRSVAYQKGIFERKLAAGQQLAVILTVNAAPGFSEHHSGCALDLGTPGYAHLEEAFENSAAFTWLSRHADAFGFSMSFPRDNAFGVQYEPWHWCYRKKVNQVGV